MAAFGQTFDSNRWLLLARTQLTYSTQLVYPKIDAGARVSVGDQVWSNWWLTTWTFVAPPFFDQGRLIRSTWLCVPLHNFAHISPMVQRASREAGSTAWNNWFFNTAYTAPNKLAFFAGRAVYHYVGGAANLGALHRYNLVAATGIYAYQGAPANSDFGMRGEFIPYSYDGGDIVSPPDLFLVQATAIGMAIDPTTGIPTLYSPGDVFYINRANFSDSSQDYMAGVPGGPFYGWMKAVPLATAPSNPAGDAPVYDFQPPPRRLVF